MATARSLDVKAFRERHGLSQMDLAQHIWGDRKDNLRRTIRRWENGSVTPSPLAQQHLDRLQTLLDGIEPARSGRAKGLGRSLAQAPSSRPLDTAPSSGPSQRPPTKTPALMSDPSREAAQTITTGTSDGPRRRISARMPTEDTSQAAAMDSQPTGPRRRSVLPSFT